MFLRICHDDPEVTSPDRICYDACVTVDDGFEPEGEIGVQMLHVGPYGREDETIAVMRTFV